MFPLAHFLICKMTRTLKGVLNVICGLAPQISCEEEVLLYNHNL